VLTPPFYCFVRQNTAPLAARMNGGNEQNMTPLGQGLPPWEQDVEGVSAATRTRNLFSYGYLTTVFLLCIIYLRITERVANVRPSERSGQ